MTQDPQHLDLDAIEQLTNATSGSIWQVLPGHPETVSALSIPQHGVATVPVAENAAFIAHARQIVPALISRIRELEAELKPYRTAAKLYDNAIRQPEFPPDMTGVQTWQDE